MVPLTPRLVIAAANAFVGLKEEGGDNRGQVVEFMLAQVKQPPGQPWCAAFVYHIGYSAHYDSRLGRSSWPLPATASCQDLYDFANPLEAVMTEPMEGDVFLVWRPKLKRFAHTGFVVSVDDVLEEPGGPRYLCTTVEGNTNTDGSANGNAALRRARTFGASDRFIRWVQLDPRSRVAA